MVSGTRPRPTTSSSSSSSPPTSSFSLPGPLGNVLSWTLSRWNSTSSDSRQLSSSPPAEQTQNNSEASAAQSHYSNVSSSLSLETSESMSSSRYETCESSLSINRPTSRHNNPNPHHHHHHYHLHHHHFHNSYTPPPLPPLTLHGYSSYTKSHLMTRSLGEEIRNLIPARLQLHDVWSLVYSLEQHGVSLHTLYERCALREFKQGGFVLVVKDDMDGIFGAFVNEAFRPSGRYYGTGECFLWKASWLTADDHHYQHDSEVSLLSTSTTTTSHSNKTVDSGVGLLVPERSTTPSSFNSHMTSHSKSGDKLRFKAFPYSGVNDYMIYCDQGFLSVGGGDGKYGLWLDNSLEKGVSSTCPTFGNEQLSEEGEKFDIIGVEVWSIGAAMAAAAVASAVVD